MWWEDHGRKGGMGGNYECGGRIMGGREGWGEPRNESIKGGKLGEREAVAYKGRMEDGIIGGREGSEGKASLEGDGSERDG